MNERVLHEYDEIQDRERALDKQMPIEDFKLARHYDTIKTQDMLHLFCS